MLQMLQSLCKCCEMLCEDFKNVANVAEALKMFQMLQSF